MRERSVKATINQRCLESDVGNWPPTPALPSAELGRRGHIRISKEQGQKVVIVIVAAGLTTCFEAFCPSSTYVSIIVAILQIFALTFLPEMGFVSTLFSRLQLVESSSSLLRDEFLAPRTYA